MSNYELVSSKLVKVNDSLYRHYCPACNLMHPVHVNPPGEAGDKWTWNGDVEKPTYSPSFKQSNWQVDRPKTCHYFIADGKLQYCTDSDHAFAGQTIELPDVPGNFEDVLF